MSLALQCIRPDNSPSIGILPAVSRAHLQQGISYPARNLLAQIVLWSGKKGYCWWSIPRIAKEFCCSQSTARRWKSELIKAGLVEELTRKGRSSYLVPYPDEFKGLLPAGVLRSDRGPLPPVTGVKEKRNQEKNVVRSPGEPTPAPQEPKPNVNNVFAVGESEDKPELEPLETVRVPEKQESERPETVQEPTRGIKAEPSKPAPQQVAPRPAKPRKPPFDMTLVREIESVTRDYRSRGAWIRIVREVDETTIRTALSATHCVELEESGVRLGAYFIGCIYNLSDFRFRRARQSTPIEPLPPKSLASPIVSPAPEPKPQERPVDKDRGKEWVKLARRVLNKEISREEAQQLMARRDG